MRKPLVQVSSGQVTGQPLICRLSSLSLCAAALPTELFILPLNCSTALYRLSSTVYRLPSTQFTQFTGSTLALFNNVTNVEIKNALAFLLVLRVIENFFIKHGWFLDFSICPTWTPSQRPLSFSNNFFFLSKHRHVG